VTRQRIDAGDPAFWRLFEAIERSWFRLETLQAYGEPGGEGLPREWLAMVQGHVAAGRQLRRVHVIREPLTAYVAWELHAYAETVEAGEDVRLLPVPDGEPWPAGVPEGEDFWIFDDQDVWVMDYDPNGRFLGCELTSEIERYRAIRDVALAASVSWSTYMSRAQLRRAG
jgi:hypothetical protein